mmetsp:Transcript_42007/g.82364  ORF Transcript_42007/g.82364 Transcript_42007/m.82364 type:complete len:226 (-) Transcript_42007:1333-2010(-)
MRSDGGIFYQLQILGLHNLDLLPQSGTLLHQPSRPHGQGVEFHLGVDPVETLVQGLDGHHAAPVENLGILQEYLHPFGIGVHVRKLVHEGLDGPKVDGPGDRVHYERAVLFELAVQRDGVTGVPGKQDAGDQHAHGHGDGKVVDEGDGHHEDHDEHVRALHLGVPAVLAPDRLWQEGGEQDEAGGPLDGVVGDHEHDAGEGGDGNEVDPGSNEQDDEEHEDGSHG